MTQSDFRTLLHRYQHGECTPAEKRRVEQWYASLGTERQLGLTADEETALMATVWERISHQTGAAAPAPAGLPGVACGPGARPEQPWPASLRWAAVALLAASTGLVATLSGSNATKWPLPVRATKQAATAPAAWHVYNNPSAYQVRIALPDGSAVTLAPTSTLRYRRSANGARRVAYLTGAASFDVFHDKDHPFSVFTDNVVTTVLGTSFRVRAYAGQPEVQVQVLTGAVRVSPRAPTRGTEIASLVVLPNQQAVYSPARRQLRRELVAQPAQLAPQSFVFSDRPVAEVLAALEKAYGVAIVYDAAAVRNCTLNLTLRDEPLFTKLDMLCETLGASYEKADGRILFHSQPCQVE